MKTTPLLRACLLAVLGFSFSCQHAERQENEKPKAQFTGDTTAEAHVLESPPPDSLHGWELATEHDLRPPPPPPSYTRRATPKSIAWQSAAPGVAYATIDAPLQCNIGDSRIRVVRIDASKAALRIISAGKDNKGQTLTAAAYCAQFNLIAAINTSMFGYEGRSVGFMKHYAHVNNGHFGTDKAVIAFNPKQDSLPPFKIIDTTCEDWTGWKNSYHSYIQNIRMIGCDRQVKWSKQEKFWSIACIGEDSKGRMLLIHSRTPYRVHDFCQMLLALPLDIQRCCYAEGGPEASLYLQTPNGPLEAFGSYETGFMESDDNQHYWELPNIIGVTAAGAN